MTLDKRTKILFVTDSLGLPREHPENLLPKETYINLLKKEFVDVEFIQLSIGGALIAQLYTQSAGYYFPYKPDMVFVQAGIVDCAPRAFSKVELSVLNSNSIFRLLSKKIIQPYSRKIRKNRNVKYTSPQLFKSFSLKFKEKFSEANVFWNGIVPAKSDYEELVPGITQSIDSYNEILKSVYKNNFIGVDEFPEDGVMADFHHLNRKGHAFFYKKIKEQILKFIACA